MPQDVFSDGRLWRNLRFWVTVRTPNGFGVGVGAPAGLCAVATSLRQPSTGDTQPSRRRGKPSRLLEYRQPKRERKPLFPKALPLANVLNPRAPPVPTPGAFLFSTRGF